jgi:hypothetical protein
MNQEETLNYIDEIYLKGGSNSAFDFINSNYKRDTNSKSYIIYEIEENFI